MIEKILSQIIEELGATGLLVVGLYWVIGKPLKKLSKHVHNINHILTAHFEHIKHKEKTING